MKKLKVYNEYRKNLGLEIWEKGNDWSTKLVGTLLDSDDYCEIIEKLIKKYSSHELFRNKKEVHHLIKKEPESTGWFSVGKNIWNNCYENITKTIKTGPYRTKYKVVVDDDIEVLFGVGDKEEECILFTKNKIGKEKLKNGKIFYNVNHQKIHIHSFQGLFHKKECISCETDSSWFYSSVKNNSIIINSSGYGIYNGETENKEIKFSPKNLIINNIISDFLDLRLKQIEHKNKIYLETINKSNEKLKDEKNSLIKEFDKDKNGLVDMIEDDVFMKLFKKNQKKIIENDKSNIQKFVKVSNYLKTKRKNIQNLYNQLIDYKFKNQFDSVTFITIDDSANILKNLIHSYELILFHSLNMINSLVEEELIIFYEIYESFDKLNMFNSNWENEVSEKLTNIEEGLVDLLLAIQKMEYNIVSQLKTLTYVTSDASLNLNKSLTTKLTDINSNLNLNNLLTGIQTYQMYKINKNID